MNKVNILFVSKNRVMFDKVQSNLSSNEIEFVLDSQPTQIEYDVCLVDSKNRGQVPKLAKDYPLSAIHICNGSIPEEFYIDVKNRWELRQSGIRINEKLKRLEKTQTTLRQRFAIPDTL